MTDHPPQTEQQPQYWSQSAPASRWATQDASPLRRFMGGSPVAVLVKLGIVSLLVGAMLVWLDIRPAEVFREVGDMINRLWALGFQSIREFGNYLIAGAAIVVPVWLVLRLLAFRGR